jgi:hypothetical protein
LTGPQVTRHLLATREEGAGLLLDRHSGVALARLPHPSCTACAVNPHNTEQAVTVGEDGFVRHWTSRRKHNAETDN